MIKLDSINIGPNFHGDPTTFIPKSGGRDPQTPMIEDYAVHKLSYVSAIYRK